MADIETIGWVVHEAKQDFKLEELVVEAPRDDELLIDMKFSGICHTVSIAVYALTVQADIVAGFGLSTGRTDTLPVSCCLWRAYSAYKDHCVG